jgi:glyoxylase-like metal-dependent hydrolase (beta-lactamase superfamily II)
MERYVDSRRVGDATVTVISDGQLHWAPQLSAPEAEWRRAMPEADQAGALSFPMNLAHVRLPDGGSVLIDLGFDEPSPSSHWPSADRSPGLVAGLASVGVAPTDVDTVLITHPHGDHVAGAVTHRDGQAVPRFPNARHVLNRQDFDAANAPLAFLQERGLLDLGEGDQQIAPGLSYHHAPGESAGHSVIRVESDGQVAYFFGDLFHHPCEVAHPDWVSPGRDRDLSLAARRRFLAQAAAEGAVCTFSHARLPAWGRIAAGDGDYRWEWL